MEPLYKIVGPEGECLNGGDGRWPLPTATEPGAWWDIDGPLQACRNGLHLATAEQLPHWLPPASRPCVVYRVETRGDLVDAGEKWVAQSVRLLPRTRPMPDFRKAEALRERRLKRAAKLRTTKVPDAWRAYLRPVLRSGLKLPPGHPGAPYVAALTAAETAYTDAVRKAEDDYQRTIRTAAVPE